MHINYQAVLNQLPSLVTEVPSNAFCQLDMFAGFVGATPLKPLQPLKASCILLNDVGKKE